MDGGHHMLSKPVRSDHLWTLVTLEWTLTFIPESRPAAAVRNAREA